MSSVSNKPLLSGSSALKAAVAHSGGCTEARAVCSVSTVLKPKAFTCPVMPPGINGILGDYVSYFSPRLLIHNSWLTLFGGLE